MKKPDKYAISHTFKKKKGFYAKSFRTKAEATAWIKKNKAKLYWHQLVEINAKSSLPKPTILFEPGSGFVKKTGTLQTHFETGMECLGLTFYEDGVHAGPNPAFDPSKPEGGNNFRYFASYEGMTFIEHGQIIEFSEGYRVGMIKDRKFAKKDGYRLSFYPQGFSRAELLKLFSSETVKVTIYIPKKNKDLEKFIRGPF